MPTSPTDPRVVRLPGVGARLDLKDTVGAPVQVVKRQDGRVELHTAGARTAELDAANAHALGAFVTGHYALDPALAERLSDVLGGLLFDWVHVPNGAHAVGRSIEELAVRRRTGVTIVAILRGSLPIVAPDPTVRLAAGDDLVIACQEQDRERFEHYITAGP
jgi:TrkA domain protein